MHSNNEQEANIINRKGLVQFLIDRKEERADEVIKKYSKFFSVLKPPFDSKIANSNDI